MSERILLALMQLFAIIAKVDEDVNSLQSAQKKSLKFRSVVELFLQSELNSSLVNKYLNLYEEFVELYHGNLKNQIAEKKRTAVNSVKLLRICDQINEELTQRQKVIVLMRIFEYIHANEIVTDQQNDFIDTVSESFNIKREEFALIKNFQKSNWDEKIDDRNILFISPTPLTFKFAKSFVLEGLDREIYILRIKSINTLFFRYVGHDELIMNGQMITNDRTYLLNNGSSIKTSKSKTLYYSDVITRFIEDNQSEKISFTVKDLTYRFKNGNFGLHPLSFEEESGNLVGIMGGSGTGKSTLLNILNGNIQPTSGTISINGIDLYARKKELEGVVGYISQDDLLIEELTVFQNLFFNTKLCFDKLSDFQIIRKVITVLHAVGLHEVKDLEVGGVLDKTISGGQRKRLNIALELIREPAILFVDEPTSGLSSRDSENIMDLLKELALKGKLIFVVIHQPSSDIFKMFDRLLILDQGGYPIFDGNPLESIVYFKTHIHHVSAEDRECRACGNVNPEQIFNIIDAKVVDEYGNFTSNRKTSPIEWNDLYTQFKHISIQDKVPKRRFEHVLSSTKRAKKWTQFKVYFQREFLSKIGNRQYLIVNTLVSPVLAVLLALFVRYYKKSDYASHYSFYLNENIPQYLFIGVIVALFLGLTVAAEEINKDKKILKRENYLNLSRGSYLFSKMSVLFIISAIQSFLFALIGNLILDINDLLLPLWLVLFSISCLANVTGLNISSAFNSAKVIYIIVPLLIIPQLLLSGVIVKFDKLNPALSKKSEVPWIGNIMASRWAYEAIVVEQVKKNDFEKIFFDLKQIRSVAAWKKDYWIPEMKNHVTNVIKHNLKEISPLQSEQLLQNEIQKEEGNWSNLKCEGCVKNPAKISKFLELVANQYVSSYNKASLQIDRRVQQMSPAAYENLLYQNVNESLFDLVTNKSEVDKIITIDNELIQKDDPIFLNPTLYSFFETPFYCPEKIVFNWKVSTFWINIAILWLMTIFTVIVLYYDLLLKLISKI